MIRETQVCFEKYKYMLKVFKNLFLILKKINNQERKNLVLRIPSPNCRFKEKKRMANEIIIYLFLTF